MKPTIGTSVPSAEQKRMKSSTRMVTKIASAMFAKKILSECTDTNKDHKCDLCGKTLSEHSGGKATCKDKAKCEFCGESYGELDDNSHADLRHIDAVAATKTAEGNIECWYCADCGKYYKDAKATQEITKEQTVTAKLPSDNNTSTSDSTGNNNKPSSDATTSPQTGDNSNLALWVSPTVCQRWRRNPRNRLRQKEKTQCKIKIK